MTWTDGVLGDFLTLKRGHDLPNGRRKAGEIPVVSSSGFTGWHNESKAEPPGVVTGRYGTIGEVFYVDQPYWPLNTALYVIDFKGNDPRFVSYFLRHHLKNYRSEKAAVPGVDRKVLHKLPARCPDPQTQQSIVQVLSVYDELIENNWRRIALLEDAARHLYKEWFVRFRFPGHEHSAIIGGVPEGWERKKLFDLAEATYGHPFKSELFSDEPVGMPVVRIRNVPDGSSQIWTIEHAPEDKVLSNGDFLIGMDGEFHMNFWSGGSAWLNQRVVRLEGKGSISTGLLRKSIEQQIKDFNETITGTTVKHLGAKHLKQIEILVPPGALLDRANEFCETVRTLAVNLGVTNRQLAKARDLLLPKLMSGAITV